LIPSVPCRTRPKPGPPAPTLTATHDPNSFTDWETSRNKGAWEVPYPAGCGRVHDDGTDETYKAHTKACLVLASGHYLFGVHRSTDRRTGIWPTYNRFSGAFVAISWFEIFVPFERLRQPLLDKTRSSESKFYFRIRKFILRQKCPILPNPRLLWFCNICTPRPLMRQTHAYFGFVKHAHQGLSCDNLHPRKPPTNLGLGSAHI